MTVETGLAPPAHSIITDSYRPAYFGYAMSFYKTGVRVGGGFALVIGGLLIDYYTRIGPLEVPLVGTLQPWQATLVTVGLPGVLLALLLLTMVEPRRKELAVSRSGRERLPVREFVRFIWQRKRCYLPLCHPCARMTGARSGSRVARIAPPGFIARRCWRWPATAPPRGTPSSSSATTA